MPRDADLLFTSMLCLLPSACLFCPGISITAAREATSSFSPSVPSKGTKSAVAIGGGRLVVEVLAMALSLGGVAWVQLVNVSTFKAFFSARACWVASAREGESLSIYFNISIKLNY